MKCASDSYALEAIAVLFVFRLTCEHSCAMDPTMIRSRVWANRKESRMNVKRKLFGNRRMRIVAATFPVLRVSVVASAVSLCPGLSSCNSSPNCNCASSCEDNFWGARMVVDVFGEYANVSVSALECDGSPAGPTYESISSPPPLDDGYKYSFIFGASPSCTTLTLKLDVPGSEPFSKEIPLKKYNACGRNMAYVEAHFEDTGIRLSDVRYISPCAEKGKVDSTTQECS